MSNSDAHEASSTMGRRERKRLLTRKQIARTAIELFDEKGFAEVTIAEIAERADVDPSTFFRHFSSKEAVIYGDYEEFLGRLGGVLRARPAKERLPTSLKYAIGQLVTDLMVSPEDELRRMRVAQASPDLRAQALAFREDLATDFAGCHRGADGRRRGNRSAAVPAGLRLARGGGLVSLVHGAHRSACGIGSGCRRADHRVRELARAERSSADAASRCCAGPAETGALRHLYHSIIRRRVTMSPNSSTRTTTDVSTADVADRCTTCTPSSTGATPCRPSISATARS